MPQDPSGQVAELLRRWVEGDKEALAGTVPVVYAELRRLAHHHLKSERLNHTLQSTALVTAEDWERVERGHCTQH